MEIALAVIAVIMVVALATAIVALQHAHIRHLKQVAQIARYNANRYHRDAQKWEARFLDRAGIPFDPRLKAVPTPRDPSEPRPNAGRKIVTATEMINDLKDQDAKGITRAPAPAPVRRVPSVPPAIVPEFLKEAGVTTQA